jgi:hypothetical protein
MFKRTKKINLIQNWIYFGKNGFSECRLKKKDENLEEEEKK